MPLKVNKRNFLVLEKLLIQMMILQWLDVKMILNVNLKKSAFYGSMMAMIDNFVHPFKIVMDLVDSQRKVENLIEMYSQ